MKVPSADTFFRESAAIRIISTPPPPVLYEFYYRTGVVGFQCLVEQQNDNLRTIFGYGPIDCDMVAELEHSLLGNFRHQWHVQRAQLRGTENALSSVQNKGADVVKIAVKLKTKLIIKLISKYSYF